MDVLKEIESLKRQHHYCDDPWYSCPLALDGCANNEYEENKCNCGAEEQNKKIDAILEYLSNNGFNKNYTYEDVKEYKEIVINAIQKIGSDCEDDHNRYKLRFSGLSKTQMNKEYGQSGETCREILDNLIKQDEKINKTIEWIKSI